MSDSAVELIRRLVAERGVLADLRRRAAATGATVVLPEGEDARVVAAALAMRELGLLRPILLGDPERVRALVAAEGADPGSIEVADPNHDTRREQLAQHLWQRRVERGLGLDGARELCAEPLHFAAGLVALSVVDAMVAGALHATQDVLRAALWHVGPRREGGVVSGSFLMVPPTGHRFERPLLFADSAVMPCPDERQLVEIGRDTAATWRSLFGRDARVACLSFSTLGSADHPQAQKMARVAELLRGVGVEADGELQVDAALVPEVARAKAPDSEVAARADVLLFPDLQSGNIGYKLAERLGGLDAVGPIVQGLARPVFDLSRGCDATAVVNTACLAALAGREEGDQSAHQ